MSAVVDLWFSYVSCRVFPGGCFVVTVSNEYGSQQGEVADAVRAAVRTWRDFIETDLRPGQPDHDRDPCLEVIASWSAASRSAGRTQV